MRRARKLHANDTITVTRLNNQDQSQSKGAPAYRSSSAVPSPAFILSLQTTNQAVPTTRSGPMTSKAPGPGTSLLAFLASTPKEKVLIFKRSKSAAPSTIRSLGISKPVTIEDDSPSRPFANIRCIDPASATINERERRRGVAVPARQLSQQLTSPSTNGALRKVTLVERELLHSRPHEELLNAVSSTVSTSSPGDANERITPLSLRSDNEEVLRHIPQDTGGFPGPFDKKMTPYPWQEKQITGLPLNPISRGATLTPGDSTKKELGEEFMSVATHSSLTSVTDKVPDIYSLKDKSRLARGPESAYVKTLGSILGRPRPYQLDTDKGRALFPIESHPNHRRSKSGSSIARTQKNSIFTFQPGSPTRLPALPDPPANATKFARLIQVTKGSIEYSKTKQSVLSEPSGLTLVENQGPSVPSVVHLPSIYTPYNPRAQTLVGESQNRRNPEGLAIALFTFEDKQNQEFAQVSKRDTYRSTTKTHAEETSDTRFPEVPPVKADPPTLQQGQLVQNLYTQAMRYHTSTKVAPGFGDSPTAYINQSLTTGDVHQTSVPIIYDQVLEGAQVSRFSTSDGCRQSLVLDAGQASLGERASRGGSFWKQRIGDEILTFSGRKNQTRARRISPPTPLLLNSRWDPKATALHGTNCSPPPSPIDSPGRAIKHIQAQLEHLEMRDRGYVRRGLPHSPSTNLTAVGSVNDDHSDRFRLLENLEEEMGQQEDYWQQMQNNFNRDSLSVVLTPEKPTPPVGSFPLDSPQRWVPRGVRPGGTVTKPEEPSHTTSAENPSNLRVGTWQQRLDDIQTEYFESAPDLLHSQSLNFPSRQLYTTSPASPDSVQSEASDEATSCLGLQILRNDVVSSRAFSDAPILWQPQRRSPKVLTSRMWNPSYTLTGDTASSVAPAKHTRPPRRLIRGNLSISSSSLWTKPSLSTVVARVGLWASPKAQSSKMSFRRATSRPQRRSRRVALLPDISRFNYGSPNAR